MTIAAIGIVFIAVPLLFPFDNPPHTSGAQKAELSNVQTALDTLIGEAVISGVQPHNAATDTAKNTWTGFPKKSDGTPIKIDRANADLGDYLRLGGTGLVTQKNTAVACP